MTCSPTTFSSSPAHTSFIAVLGLVDGSICHGPYLSTDEEDE
jgi:hypothetical protein